MAIDENWVKQELERRNKEEAERLEEAKKVAHMRGKEAFDLDQFEQLYDTETDLGYLPPREKREVRWAVKYYLDYPDVLSMAQLAKRLEEYDVYRS